MTDVALGALPTFAVPCGTPESRCRRCGGPVYWITILGGRRIAIDCPVPPIARLDGEGVPHIFVCEQP